MTDEVLSQEDKEYIAEADGLSVDELDEILGVNESLGDEPEAEPEPEAPVEEAARGSPF